MNKEDYEAEAVLNREPMPLSLFDRLVLKPGKEEGNLFSSLNGENSNVTEGYVHNPFVVSEIIVTSSEDEELYVRFLRGSMLAYETWIVARKNKEMVRRLWTPVMIFSHQNFALSIRGHSPIALNRLYTGVLNGTTYYQAF